MKPIQELMQKPMSRKEFLRLFVAAILSLFGVANFIQYLLSHASSQSKQTTVTQAPQERHGFGASKFGV